MGRLARQLFVLAICGFMIAACSAGTTLRATRSGHSATEVTAPTTTESTTSVPTTTITDPNLQILQPQTTPPISDECSEKLTYSADGNGTPLLCPDGGVNVLAWTEYAASDLQVMQLGPSASASQVYSAMCSDSASGHSTFTTESSAEQLTAHYNGWSFGNESEYVDYLGANCPSSTTTTIAAPPPTTVVTPPPTTVVATGYFNKSQVESFFSSIASSRGGVLNWSYSRSNDDYEATTDDEVCTFALTNSEGESSSLIDSINVSCGPPGISGSLTKADVNEATPYLFGIVQQISGTAATNWLTEKVSSAGTGSGVTGDKEFGPVAVQVSFGDGQLSETLLWQG